MIKTYDTKYGLVSLYANEVFIGDIFQRGEYWDEETMLSLQPYIDPNRNILEIGGHVGTSTLVYSSFLDQGKIHVYEPQKNIYELLVKNIYQNNLQDKIIPYNKGVFCYSGKGIMNAIDIDGGGGNVSKRYTEETELPCNFGGIGLGKDGESIDLTTMDEMDITNVGFIHMDAQGAEYYIFSKGKNLIARDRPVILFENNKSYCQSYSEIVKNTYPEYHKDGDFDIFDYCINQLNYSMVYEQYRGSVDTLLIP